MPLRSTGEPGRSDFPDVKFVMEDGRKRVVCYATGSALQDIEQATPNQDERLRIFERHRVRFEQIASGLYDAGYQPRVTTEHLSR